MNLRSIIFNIIFYLGSVVYALLLLPCLITKRSTLWGIRVWTHLVLWLMKIILRLNYRVTTYGDLPENGAIYACKHQSAWETIALWLIVPKPVFVIKQELYNLPVVGWWIRRSGCIALNRKAGASSIKKLIKEAKAAVEAGNNIVIFPEGTRSLPNQQIKYLPGISALYKYLQLPIIPIALNSGLFWPRNAFIKKPGVIDVVLLEALPAGQDAKVMLQQLQHKIESTTQKLTSPSHEKL